MKHTLPALLALAWAAQCAVVGYDSGRVNNSETRLAPSTLWAVGKLGTYALDGPIAAQPLFISGSPNVLIVATMNNTLYALNADLPGASPIWLTNFGANWNVGAGAFFNVFYGASIGILSTPVSDGTYIYLVTVNNTPTYTLRKVAISSGVQSASVAISGSVTGTGAGTVGGITDDTTGSSLNFHSAWQLQRGALALANGNVYLTFGAAGDEAEVWHGWIFAYSTSALSQVAVWCSTPNNNGAGVWEAGGLAADGSGNLYAVTGNGDWDGSTAFAQTVLKFNSSLVLQDWFTPSNHASTQTIPPDADLSSGRVILIPGTKYLTLGSKDGRVWVIDTTSMGHLQGTGTAPQVLSTASFSASFATGTYGGLFFGSVGYFPLVGLQTYSFAFSGSTYGATPTISGASYYQMALAGSSNSGSGSILWATTPDTGVPNTAEQTTTLRALNPSTMAELWNSGPVGHYSKYISPVVGNAHVYVPTWDGNVVVFGLPPLPVSVTGILVDATQ